LWKQDAIIARGIDDKETCVMVEELREAIEQVERQPEEIQRRIAQIITEELEEREWDALVSSTASQRFLAHLSAGIDAQEAANEVEDGGWEL